MSEISLRPGISFRPGGGSLPASNPFAAFAKGAGAGTRPKAADDAVEAPEIPAKPRSEVTIYTAEFLQSFQEKCTRMPEGLDAKKEIFMEPASVSAGRPPAPTAPAAEPVVDNRDWRARTAPEQGAAPSAPSRNSSQQQLAPAQEGRASRAASGQLPEAKTEAGKPDAAKPDAAKPAAPAAQAQAQSTATFLKAEDAGRTAWKPAGSSLSDTQKAVKTVKGILNKLTPETFDKLLENLKATISSAEILHGSITLVFESAVAQPTFVSMYAELCVRLSKELPDFDASGRTRAFQRVLLNTCQEEFEGAETARQALKDGSEADDFDAAARKLKLRLLGNIRLIAELFKQKALGEKILHACVGELIGDPKGTPPEENVEAVCEFFTIAGKPLEETTRERKKFEGYFTVLEKWSKNPALASRIRFLVRDVVDLRRSKWIPRREALKAKKLTEVRAEAHAELGMVPPPPANTLPAMPLLQAALVGKPVPEMELFPAFKGSEAGWENIIKPGGKPVANGGGDSALLGDYIAPDIFVPAEPEPVTAAPATADARPGKEMDEEGKRKAVKLLLAEFQSSFDQGEATTCVRELGPGSGPLVMEATLDALFDAATARPAEELCALMSHWVVEGVLPQPDFMEALGSNVEQIDDLRLDIPKAPQLLAQLHARAIADRAVPLGSLQEVCSRVEDMEPRQEHADAVWAALKKAEGLDLAALSKEGSFSCEGWLDKPLEA